MITRQIGTVLFTWVGSVVAISKLRGGGISWRLWGITTYAYLKMRWLAERSAAAEGVVVIGSASSEVQGDAVVQKHMTSQAGGVEAEAKREVGVNCEEVK